MALIPTFASSHSDSIMTAIQNSSRLGKRYADEMTSQLEAALTEFYRQECLRSLYKPKEVERTIKRKRVSISATPEIIGCADPHVDRRPIDVTPFSQLEMLVILSQRTFPVQA